MVTEKSRERAMQAVVRCLDCSEQELKGWKDDDGIVLAQFVQDLDQEIRALVEFVIEHHVDYCPVCPKCKDNKFWQRIRKIWGNK